MFGTVLGSVNAGYDRNDGTTREQTGGRGQVALMKKESVILIEGKQEG